MRGRIFRIVITLVLLVLALPGRTLGQASGPPADASIFFSSNNVIHRYDVDTGEIVEVANTSGSYPSVSPDGQRLCFETNESGNLEIVCTDRYGNNAVNLTNDENAADGMPRFSPDGTKIAYHRRNHSDAASLYQIWVMDADGSNKTQLTDETRYMGEPAWFPDGSKLVFDGDKPDRNILVVNLDGSGLQVINDQGKSQRSPSVSPDGQYIYYDSDENGIFQVYRMRVDGSDQTPLTSSADGSNRMPQLSSDGEWLTFTSNRDGNYEVYMMRVDGTDTQRITSSTAVDTTPVWAAAPSSSSQPEGKIVFESNRDGNWEIYTMNADGSELTRLTNNPADDGNPKWSADGSRVVFHSNRDGNYEIYTMNADGSNQTRITNNTASDVWPSWSPDGSQIAFHSGRDGNSEIYIMNADGTGQTRITNNTANDHWATWSPDGTQIAFYSDRDSNDEIYVMNADGSNQTRLTYNSTNDRDPVWSPDGTKFLFWSDRDGNNEVYMMNTDGSNQTRLTNNPASDGEAADWSPDGAYIIFASERDGNREIYLMNVDGTGQTRITYSDGVDAYPSWQRATPPPPPPGKVVFESDRDGDSEIYTMNMDGSDLQQLTNNTVTDRAPRWSPDGSRITFYSDRDGIAEIYVMDADGSNQIRLTNNVEWDTWSHWSPDGTRIAFATGRDGAGNDEVYVMNADGTGQTNLTNSPGNDTWPVWSPDGSQIVFYSERDGNLEIYVMNADGTGQTRLTTDPARDWNPAWSPDGSKIAFISDRDGNSEIHIMSTDGSGQTNLTNSAAGDTDPTWSPDGTQITFASDRDGNYEVYSMNADGSDVTRITYDSAADNYPSWYASPATTNPLIDLVVFVSDRDGNNEIYTMNPDGSNPVNLTNNPAWDGDPMWSPDGTRIAFDSQRDGNLEIYTMNANGTELRRLTNDPAIDQDPAWSPDGTKIAFQSNRDGDSEIYVMDVDGSNVTQLTNNTAHEEFAWWSPDGSQITFHSNRDGNREIYVMDADGSNQIRLTTDPGEDNFATWSPDGSQIVFDSTRDGDFEIYVMDADGSNQTRITNTPGVDERYPRWSPDGTQIIFTDISGADEIYIMNADGTGPVNITNHPSTDDDAHWGRVARLPTPPEMIAFTSDEDGNREIYVMDEHGKGIINLTNERSADDWAPTWSITGTRMVFLSDRDRSTKLYLMDTEYLTDTDAIADVVPLSDTLVVNNDAPAWSPAEDILLFSSDHEEPGNIDIYAMHVESREVMRLTDDPAEDFSARWSPDGNYIVFSSRRDNGEVNTYIMNKYGESEERLGNGTGSEFAWSPTAPVIAFQDDPDGDGNPQIFRMDADGRDRQPLTDPDDEAASMPAWSYRGDKIAVMSGAEGDHDIVVMNPDGTGAQRLTNTPGVDESNPVWRPPQYPYIASISPDSAVANAGNVPVSIQLKGRTDQIAGAAITASIGTVDLLHLTYEEEEQTIRAVVPLDSFVLADRDRVFRTGSPASFNVSMHADTTHIASHVGFTVKPPVKPSDIVMSVYMACDDPVLEGKCKEVYKKLEQTVADWQSGSDKLTIYVLWDGHSHTNSYYCRVHPPNSYAIPDKSECTTVEPEAEVNTGEQETLTNFLRWVTTEAPPHPLKPQRRLLVMYGSGGVPVATPPTVFGPGEMKPVDGMWCDKTFVPVDPGNPICYGAQPNTMSASQMQDALSEAFDNHADIEGFDVIYLDSSLLGTMHLANALAPYTRHIVAHENITWFADLHDIYLDPATTDLSSADFPQQLAQRRLAATGTSRLNQVTVIDTDKFMSSNPSATVAAEWEYLAYELWIYRGDLTVRDAVQDVLDTVARVNSNGDGTIDANDSYIDAYRFASLLHAKELPSHPSIKSAAWDFMTAFGDAVTSYDNIAGIPGDPETEHVSSLEGLSVPFPTGEDCHDMEEYRTTLGEEFQSWIALVSKWNKPPTELSSPAEEKTCEPIYPRGASVSVKAPENMCQNNLVWVTVELEHVVDGQDPRGLAMSVVANDTSILVPATGNTPLWGPFSNEIATMPDAQATSNGWDFFITSPTAGGNPPLRNGLIVELPFYAVGQGTAHVEVTHQVLTGEAGNELPSFAKSAAEITVGAPCAKQPGTITGHIDLEGPRRCENVQIELWQEQELRLARTATLRVVTPPNTPTPDTSKPMPTPTSTPGTSKPTPTPTPKVAPGEPIIISPDSTCTYKFTDVPPGIYTLWFRRALFVDAVREDIRLEPGMPKKLDDVDMWAGDLDGRSAPGGIAVTNDDWQLCRSQILPTPLEDNPLYDINGDGKTNVQDCQLLTNNIHLPNLATINLPADKPTKYVPRAAVQTALQSDTARDAKEYLSLVPQDDGSVVLHMSVLTETVYAVGAQIMLPEGATVTDIVVPSAITGGFVEWVQVEDTLYIALDVGNAGSDMTEGVDIAHISLDMARSAGGSAEIESANLVLDAGPLPPFGDLVFLPLIGR